MSYDQGTVAILTYASGITVLFATIALALTISLGTGDLLTYLFLGIVLATHTSVLAFYVFGYVPRLFPKYMACCNRLGHACSYVWCCHWVQLVPREQGESLVDAN
jgi:hypothetical protein